MNKQTFPFLLFLLAGFYFCIPAAAQSMACCDNPSCRTKSHELAVALGNSVNFLGTYPSGQPIDAAGKKKFIESLKVDKPGDYDKIVKAAKGIHNWTGKDASRKVCLSREYANLTPDQLQWINYFLTYFYSSSFHSPEFAKGIGLQLHSGIGAAKLFANTERFVSISGAFVSYTFTPKSEVTGGHLRILIGPSLYYSRSRAYFGINPKAEFRIGDIGNELTSIGCIKLIAQGNFFKNIQLGGLGLAAEISRFNVELTGDYDFNHRAVIIQAGLGYAFYSQKLNK